MNINKNSLPEGELPMVEVSNVRKTYVLGSLEIPVLSDVSPKIERGEFLPIMGPSCSEKSTLVNLVGCLDMPTEGRVLLRGRGFNRMSDQELARLRGLEIGFAFQTFNLVPRLTAFENVLLPIFANSKTGINLKRYARELLEIMGLRDHINQRLGNFQETSPRRSQLHMRLLMTLRSFLRMSQPGTLTPEQEPKSFEYSWI